MKKSLERIILGTVQFGMNYGINNKDGQISEEEVQNILSYAQSVNIDTLDTAAGYGDSEVRIGQYNSSHQPFKIITKFDKINKIDWETSIKNSIQKLNVRKVDVAMYHSFESYLQNKSKLPEILTRGKNKYFDKIGVSIYSNEELGLLIEDANVQVIQLPFNLLDNHSLKGELLKQAKEKGKIIHVRSVFLQGLFYKEIESLQPKYEGLKSALNKVKNIVREKEIDINALALQYVLSKEYIDGVLIGVDSRHQLEQNVEALKVEIDSNVFTEIDKIQVENIDLLNPSKW